ncbi:hypothetical protein BDP55DRAFT_688705 [Colletotrichum godetiae]|uniref:Uncharacterized protein n=1 Tax=Colletotrichum godetiae TaxID=1209918 RepID=A0AAJ0A8M2_9PEZI|nr:uncharacterized protein BDP55DRAFT_688705 [Colletotrichum godetiae]KAK1656545.1 hypothetical protein BDP55DRAFT_688705 [Colletotrichum godetiae]
MEHGLRPTPMANCISRASALVVDVGPTVQPWGTQTLRGFREQTEPLDSVLHHQICLIKTLSTPQSIWYLACIMVPKPSETELHQSANQISDFQLIHIKASVIRVDMREQNEVVFKLTGESINSLIKYHESSNCVGIVAKMQQQARNDRMRKKVREDFLQAIKEFVYRTNVSALKGLEEDGAGELLGDDSEKVKRIILGMMESPDGTSGISQLS